MNRPEDDFKGYMDEIQAREQYAEAYRMKMEEHEVSNETLVQREYLENRF